ncbi:PhoH family protein [uncultured Corynebacterium sp.]|uniref:PhoH family protein n=1 Tax=uncultured Corynebacterium sp. TaxID=159447 RepID=UPI0025DBB56A|nr:PhoH family protein [uncultured Corynebacterium sp.]
MTDPTRQPHRHSVDQTTQAIIELDPAHAPTVLGQADRNLRLLENLLGADVHARGTTVTVTGRPSHVATAARAFKELESMARRGHELSTDSVTRAVGLVGADAGTGGPGAADVLAGEIIARRGKVVRPKTQGQKDYVDAIDRNTIVFGIGPAGTGKTYLAMAKAVQALQRKEVERIILTRPAVEAGENLGFLPGTLHEKIDPYLRPLHDALRDMMDPEQIPKLMESGVIEVAPLAYMRGRTLNNAFIILDEAQNTTPAQMKMFLTRLGFGAKMVVTGDATQVDLPRGQRSGLDVVRRILGGIDGIAFPRLGAADVVRHSLVSLIVEAYDDHDAAEKERAERKAERKSDRKNDGGKSGKSGGSGNGKFGAHGVRDAGGDWKWKSGEDE